MTNREVIDKMTNEELGRFLDSIDCVHCAYHENYGEVVPDICNGLKHCAEGIAKWLGSKADFRMADYIHEEENPECPLCKRYGLEKGDSLYQAYYPDSGISFDEIRVRYCPLCGKELKEDNT